MSPYPADPEWARGPMRIVLTTFPDRARADSAVAAALTGRLAACAQVVPVDSRFWWQGRIASGAEALVLFKTVPKRVGALFGLLAARHPYDVPEIVELDVPRAAPSYLAWLVETLDRSAASPPRARRPAGRRARGARVPARTRAPPRPRSRRTRNR